MQVEIERFQKLVHIVQIGSKMRHFIDNISKSNLINFGTIIVKNRQLHYTIRYYLNKNGRPLKLFINLNNW